VAEDEAEFGKITAIVRRLIEHLLLTLLEQFDRLFALTHQIVDEHAEVFIAVQHLHTVLILAIDEPQSLIRVGQNIEDKWWRVLKVHTLVLAEFHDFVH